MLADTCARVFDSGQTRIESTATARHRGGMATKSTCATCVVRERALCAALSDDQLPELNRMGRRRNLARGETLSWAGGESLVCANLISGLMKVTASTPDGRAQVVGLVHPADFVGRPYAEDADFTVTAVQESELCVFPRDRFERAVETHPPMERLLLQRTFAALDSARDRMLTLARKTASERVAGLLLELAANSEKPGQSSFDLPLTRGEMAEVLGLTIETVSRQLTRLRKGGIVSLHGARGITIQDRSALQGLAGYARESRTHAMH